MYYEHFTPNQCIKMKRLISFLCIMLLCIKSIEMMTEAQMKSTAKLMRNVCQPKTKVTNAQIDDMHKGIFDEDSKAQCYMLCVLQMMKAMKNGKLDYEFALSAVSTLAPKYQEPTRATLENCKEAVQSSDHCEAGYQLAKCMYFSNPEYYFLP